MRHYKKMLNYWQDLSAEKKTSIILIYQWILLMNLRILIIDKIFFNNENLSIKFVDNIFQ